MFQRLCVAATMSSFFVLMRDDRVKAVYEPCRGPLLLAWLPGHQFGVENTGIHRESATSSIATANPVMRHERGMSDTMQYITRPDLPGRNAKIGHTLGNEVIHRLGIRGRKVSGVRLRVIRWSNDGGRRSLRAYAQTNLENRLNGLSIIV